MQTMVDLRKLLDKENFTTLTSETLTNDPKYQIKNLKVSQGCLNIQLDLDFI
jgi:hypothetical protein